MFGLWISPVVALFVPVVSIVAHGGAVSSRWLPVGRALGGVT